MRRGEDRAHLVGDGDGDHPLFERNPPCRCRDEDEATEDLTAAQHGQLDAGPG